MKNNESSTLNQTVYNYILNMILTKQLMPGDKIPELRITQELQVSRTPVRDALRQLANDGLIVIMPKRFVKVIDYDVNEIHSIGVLRIALDSLCVQLASLYGSLSDFINLSKIAQKCVDAYDKGDILLKHQYDTDFHMELARVCNNPLLLKFQQELYLRVMFTMIHHPDPMEHERQHLDQHFEILDALRKHDKSKALMLIRDHISAIYNLKSEYPDDLFND